MQHTYSRASDIFMKLLGIEINAKQIERVCTFYGNKLYESQNSRPLQHSKRIKSKEYSERLYVLIDGSFVLIRHNSLPVNEQSESQGRDCWKEVKLARLINEQHIVKGISKNRNYVSHSEYVVHLGEAETFFAILRETISRYPNRDLVFICDGARWIWNWIEDTYPKSTQILDFFHAKEHLCDLAKIYISDQEDRKEWVSEQEKQIINDNVEEVLEELENVKLNGSTGKTIKKEIEKLINYFTDHRDRMRYKTYQNAGLEIGSGAVESAHRTIIQQRAKLSGQRWTSTGVQGILSLRAAYIGGNWSQLLSLINGN